MSKRTIDSIEMSLFAGALFGLAIYFIMLRINEQLWYLSILAGLALALLLMAYMIGYDKLVNSRYEKAFAQTGLQAELECVGNFHTEIGKRTGRIYFCGDRIVLLGLDKKPHTQIEILASEVESYEMPRVVQLNLQMKDGNYHTIHTGEVGALSALMKKKHWGKKK